MKKSLRELLVFGCSTAADGAELVDGELLFPEGISKRFAAFGESKWTAFALYLKFIKTH